MTSIQATVFASSLLKFRCKLLMRGGTLLILVNVKFDTLSVKPCGHNTDYRFCPITFKHLAYIVDVERRNPIDFGLWDQILHSVHKTLLAKYRLQFLPNYS